ncbi:MAG: stage II sporulation protein D [Ruminococcus sp.]|nr:stage II sporulation protein D [Ruminococcus sp.]
MKRDLLSLVIIAVSAAGIPALPAVISGDEQPGTPEIREFSDLDTVEEAPEPYRVLDTATGEVTEVPVRDYVIGAVCAEMPAAFEEEALKAQAAAAHTYAERLRLRRLSSPDPELKGADLSNDTSKYQGYLTLDQIRTYYGEDFDEYYEKVSRAADEVLPYIITYEDEPIISAFCSMSSGMTESAENAWGEAVDYLVPVESPQDVNAPRFLEEAQFSQEVLREKLSSAFGEPDLSGDMGDWVKILQVSPSGTVLRASVGGIDVTGGELRTALGLRSAAFDWSVQGGTAVFTTKGYGHGVGMSQYGANAMAQAGSTWQEIIAHYYPGCTVTCQESPR